MSRSLVRFAVRVPLHAGRNRLSFPATRASQEVSSGWVLRQNYLVMLDERARVRQQQELAREINSRIAEIDWTDAEKDTVDFLCECGADDCVGTVLLTPNEYNSLRHRGLVIREGHTIQFALD
jgi:hypothetical protein